MCANYSGFCPPCFTLIATRLDLDTNAGAAKAKLAGQTQEVISINKLLVQTRAQQGQRKQVNFRHTASGLSTDISACLCVMGVSKQAAADASVNCTVGVARNCHITVSC